MGTRKCAPELEGVGVSSAVRSISSACRVFHDKHILPKTRTVFAGEAPGLLGKGSFGRGGWEGKVTSRIHGVWYEDILLDTEHVCATYERRGHRVRAVLITDVFGLEWRRAWSPHPLNLGRAYLEDVKLIFYGKFEA